MFIERLKAGNNFFNVNLLDSQTMNHTSVLKTGLKRNFIDTSWSQDSSSLRFLKLVFSIKAVHVMLMMGLTYFIILHKN